MNAPRRLPFLVECGHPGLECRGKPHEGRGHSLNLISVVYLGHRVLTHQRKYIRTRIRKCSLPTYTYESQLAKSAHVYSETRKSGMNTLPRIDIRSLKDPREPRARCFRASLSLHPLHDPSCEETAKRSLRCCKSTTSGTSPLPPGSGCSNRPLNGTSTQDSLRAFPPPIKN